MALKTYATHFCGIGGACAGIEQAGLKCVLAIDYLPIAVEYREKNLGHHALNIDISEYVPDQAHAADVLWTSPSCQSFSTSARDKIVSNKSIGKKEIRDSLFLASVKYCEVFKPKYFVLENVTGLLTHFAEGKPTINLIRDVFEKRAGYHTEWNVLSSIEWNLPQQRRRVVVVGSRDGQKGLIPRSPFGSPTCKFGDIKQHGRMDLAWKGPTYKTALEKVKRTGIDIRVISEDEIIPTVTCGWGGGATRKKVAIVDQTEDGVNFLRHPSVQEGAAAQGFPTGWRYPDSDTVAWTLIGNAVPPPMSKSIIEHLIKVDAGENPPSKTTIPNFVPEDIREYGDDMPRELALD